MRSFKVLLFVVMFGCTCMNAQNKQLLYDFKEIPQALLLNPGMEIGYQWYGGIPALSGLSLQFGTSGITFHDIFADDGIDINTKIRERAINGMSITDEFSGTFQIDLLNGGFRGKKNTDNFYSFGMYLEGDAIVYWLGDVASLAFEGNANQLNRKFDLGHIKTRGELVNVFHVGFNKRMGNNLTIGGRVKLYAGILNFSSTKNSGYFQTTEGENNFFANTLDADLELKSSGLFETLDALKDDSTPITDVIRKKALLGASLGLGVDVGFTYHLNEQSVITASVLDLGFINNADKIRTFNLNGRDAIEGLEVILPGALLNPNANLWQELVDEVEALIPFEETNVSYITFRPTKLYASYRYNFGKEILTLTDCDCDGIATNRNLAYQYVNSAGVQFYAINRPRGPQAALSVFYQRKFGNTFSVKGTYTVDKFSFTNVGIGVNFQLGPVNMFAMADNLMAYRNIADTHYTSFQLGLNIISW